MCCYSVLYYKLLGHIGRVDKTPVSGYRGKWFKSSAVPICCILEQDISSVFFQSTEVIN